MSSLQTSQAIKTYLIHFILIAFIIGCILDLLTTRVHHTELQITLTLFLISTPQVTPRQVSSICFHLSLLGNSSQQWLFLCSVFTRRLLVTNLNTRGSSASVVKPLPAG
jgi:hypothetical protein